jgi:hypothetical protein
VEREREFRKRRKGRGGGRKDDSSIPFANAHLLNKWKNRRRENLKKIDGLG